MPNRRVLDPIEVLITIIFLVVIVGLLFPIFSMVRQERRVSSAVRGEYKLNEGDIRDLRQSSRYGRLMRKYPRAMELYPELRTSAEQEWMRRPTTTDIIGPTTQRTLAVMLADGRVVRVMIAIPAGTEVSSVTVLPDVVEAAPRAP